MTTLELLATELGTFVATTAALPLSRLIASESLDAPSRHPTPVVLLHGLFGSPVNFWTLRQHLARRGIARFTNFTYRPQVDYQGLAPRLGAFLDELCRRSGTDAVGGTAPRGRAAHYPSRRALRGAGGVRSSGEARPAVGVLTVRRRSA